MSDAPMRARAPALGILAGMGPRSTGPFIDLVLDACERLYGAADDLDFPLLMVCSMPVPFVPQAAAHDAQAEFVAVREGLQRLDTPDVGVLAIACNTAHVHWPALAQSVRTPLLDMVALAAAAVPADARVAVLCSRPTADAQLYPQRLRAAGRRVVDMAWQHDVDALLAATRQRATATEFAARWATLHAQARAAGADHVLIACLDLSAVCMHDAAEGALPATDAAQVLAEALVREWLVRGGGRARGFEPAAARRTLGARTYWIGSDARDQDVDATHTFLSGAYWSAGIPSEVVERSMRGSLCFSLWCDHVEGSGARELAGFARAVTDHATFAYLCDVFVTEPHRGQGLSHWLMQTVRAHPQLQQLRRFMLATRDAHTLYASHGFEPLAVPQRVMEILRPDIYHQGAAR